MSCKYPIILAHGIILKDIKFFKAFGRIEKILKNKIIWFILLKLMGMAQ